MVNLTKQEFLWNWTEECQDSFEELKRLLLSAPILRFYDPYFKTMIETDASNGVIAGVCSQQDPTTMEWHPIAFFTKTMVTAELNYDIHDKEMLAIIRSMEVWRPELQGIQTEE